MKREYHNKFKYNDVLINNMTLETNVLVAIFLAGIAKTVIFIVVINYFLGRKDNLKNTTVECKK
jgi:ERCC4-related helicase